MATYVVSGGNIWGASACTRSPARTPKALTVGASTRTDGRSQLSATGPCLDLFAPGEDITSAASDSNAATSVMSGTSQAAAHVAGVAALYLQHDTAAAPATVASWIVDTATAGKVSDAGSLSPNKLVNWIEDDPQITVARRPNGKTDVLMRAANGNASIATLEASGRLSMPWTSLGTQVLGAPTGSWSQDGLTFDVFAIATNYRIGGMCRGWCRTRAASPLRSAGRRCRYCCVAATTSRCCTA